MCLFFKGFDVVKKKVVKVNKGKEAPPTRVPTQRSLDIFDRALRKMALGRATYTSYRSEGLDKDTFYNIIKDEACYQKYRKARASGADYLQKDLEKTPQGKMFMLARTHPKDFGKHREDNVRLTFSDDTKAIMADPESTAQEKLGALASDLTANNINLAVYERLVATVKMCHPELSKTELSGEIHINEKFMPTK